MGIRVLIAEDHVMVRQGLRALLDREGFEVVGEASNGHEAVQSATEVDPDVVVMDVSMPVMNGVDAAQEISQRSAKAKAVPNEIAAIMAASSVQIEELRAALVTLRDSIKEQTNP